jgi:predicted enzyme related to lactoylglutathione lyase
VNLILDRTVQAGGKIIVPKTLIGEDTGYYAFIVDTEGNRVALHSVR